MEPAVSSRLEAYWLDAELLNHETPKQRYRLRAGPDNCAACERRMQGQYNHGAPYYRCRFPNEYALANRVEHPRNVYLREDTLTEPLDAWLASAFAPHRLEQAITAMADAQTQDPQPSHTSAARAAIAGCDAKLRRYRAALDAGADPTVVSGWIADTEAERARAQAALHADAPPRARRLTRAEVATLVQALGDIVAVLRDADPDDKAEVYRQLGLRLTYEAETQTVHAETDLSAHRNVVDGGAMVRVRGGTQTDTPPPLILAGILHLTD